MAKHAIQALMDSTVAMPMKESLAAPKTYPTCAIKQVQKNQIAPTSALKQSSFATINTRAFEIVQVIKLQPILMILEAVNKHPGLYRLEQLEQFLAQPYLELTRLLFTSLLVFWY